MYGPTETKEDRTIGASMKNTQRSLFYSIVLVALMVCFAKEVGKARAGTAYTATVTGNWNNAATWGGVGIPGIGDTYTINSGVTVTIPTGVSVTVGTSPAGCNMGVSCTIIGTNNGPLVVNGSLTAQGSISQGNAPVTCGADGAITFDASLATTPLSQHYAWVSDGFAIGARVFTGNGTLGHSCNISSNAGGGNGYFWSDAGFADSQNWNATYTNFTRIGDATNPAIMFDPSGATAAFNQTFTNCVFDTTGAFRDTGNNFPAVAGFNIQNSTWKNSIGVVLSGITYNIVLSTVDTTPTGQRLIENNVFDESVEIATVGATITGNEFLAGFFPISQSGATSWAAFSGNLLVISDIAHTFTPLGTVSANYAVNLFSTTPVYSGTIASTTSLTLTVSGTPWTTNQYLSGPPNSYDLQFTSGACTGESHNIQSNTSSVLTFLYSERCTPTAGDAFAIYQSYYNVHWGFPILGTSYLVTNNTFEQTGTDSNGDLFTGSKPNVCTGSATFITTITGNLSLPSASLDNPGVTTGVGACTSPNYQYFGNHNTFYAGGQSGLAVAEGGAGSAGTIQQWQDTITWNVGGIAFQTSPSGFGLGQFVMTNVGSTSPATGQVLLADHNGKFNLLAGRAGTPGGGYDISSPGTGSFGTGDVVGDPQFVDPNRNMWKFGLSVGCTGSRMPAIQCVLDGISKMNDPTGYNPAFSISALNTYVRAGFQPTNRAYCGAAHDGTDIGAIPCAGITPSGVQMSGKVSTSGKVSIQ